MKLSNDYPKQDYILACLPCQDYSNPSKAQSATSKDNIVAYTDKLATTADRIVAFTDNIFASTDQIVISKDQIVAFAD